MAVRYHIDADTLGLAKVLAALRIDVTCPGDPGATIKRRKRPPCPVTSTAVPDDQWIPIVARAGWSIITRDQRIRSRPAEIAAITASRAKVFAITSDERLNNWHQLEIVMCQWRRIEQLGGQHGPFVYSMTRTTFSSLLKSPIG